MNKILSMSVDEEVEKDLNKLQQTLKLRNRSETIRVALSTLKSEVEDLNKLKNWITGVAIIVHKDVNEEKLHALKHEFNDILTTQIHNYFSGDCIEVFIVNGNAERIRKFAKELKNPNYTYSKLIIPS